MRQTIMYQRARAGEETDSLWIKSHAILPGLPASSKVGCRPQGPAASPLEPTEWLPCSFSTPTRQLAWCWLSLTSFLPVRLPGEWTEIGFLFYLFSKIDLKAISILQSTVNSWAYKIMIKASIPLRWNHAFSKLVSAGLPPESHPLCLHFPSSNAGRVIEAISYSDGVKI